MSSTAGYGVNDCQDAFLPFLIFFNAPELRTTQASISNVESPNSVTRVVYASTRGQTSQMLGGIYQ